MNNKAVKWVINKFVEEIKATNDESDATMPGDWISPAGKMISGTYGVAKTVTSKIKEKRGKKTEQPEELTTCQVPYTTCKKAISCSDCGRCTSHCNCKSKEKPASKFWTCAYCDVPQPNNLNQCGNCHGPRPSSTY